MSTTIYSVTITEQYNGTVETKLFKNKLDAERWFMEQQINLNAKHQKENRKTGGHWSYFRCLPPQKSLARIRAEYGHYDQYYGDRTNYVEIRLNKHQL